MTLMISQLNQFQTSFPLLYILKLQSNCVFRIISLIVLSWPVTLKTPCSSSKTVSASQTLCWGTGRGIQTTLQQSQASMESKVFLIFICSTCRKKPRLPDTGINVRIPRWITSITQYNRDRTNFFVVILMYNCSCNLTV